MRQASAHVLLGVHHANLLYLQDIRCEVVVELKQVELFELAFAEAMQIGDEIVGKVQLFQPRQVAVDFLPKVFDECEEVITEVDCLYIIKIPEGHVLNACDPVLT